MLGRNIITDVCFLCLVSIPNLSPSESAMPMMSTTAIDPAINGKKRQNSSRYMHEASIHIMHGYILLE